MFVFTVWKFIRRKAVSYLNETDIEKMNFKELRSKVYELESVVIKLKRMYEDVIYNLDDSNFSSSWVREKNNMKAQLRLTAEELSSIYTRVDNDLTTMQTEISQTAEEISLKASQEEVDKWGKDLKKEIAEITIDSEQIKSTISNELKSGGSIRKEISSTVQQTANEIYFKVSQYSHDYFESKKIPTTSTTTEEQRMMLCLCDGEYYAYDRSSKKWKTVEAEQGTTIQTQFKQTATGFEMNGNLIADGTIKADKIITNTLACTKLYDGIWEDIENSAYFAVQTPVSTTKYGNFGLYRTGKVFSAPSSLDCGFGAVTYEEKNVETEYMHYVSKIYANGNCFLSIGNDEKDDSYLEYYPEADKPGRTYAQGIWDFTGAFVILPKNSYTAKNGRKIYHDSTYSSTSHIEGAT